MSLWFIRCFVILVRLDKMRFSVALALGFWVFQFLDEFSLLFMSDSSHLFIFYFFVASSSCVMLLSYCIFYFLFFIYLLFEMDIDIL